MKSRRGKNKCEGVKIVHSVSPRSRSRGNVRDCVSCFSVVQSSVSASSPALTSSATLMKPVTDEQTLRSMK